jgi:hypothetical protein
MSRRALVVIGAIATVLGSLPFVTAHRDPSEARRRGDVTERAVRAERDEAMPADLRASIPQRGPSLPRPEVVRPLRRQGSER